MSPRLLKINICKTLVAAKISVLITAIEYYYLQNCVCAAKIKSYLVPNNAAPARGVNNENNRNLIPSTKMLPISDDEFVVTFTD